jgi:hypothetical protein
MYFPLGFGVAYATLTSPRVKATAMALVIAAPIEYLQGSTGHYPVIASLALSACGAFLGAWVGSDGWAQFRLWVKPGSLTA